MPDTREQRAQARVGQVLTERWHLDRLLGLGGFGAVYAAEHVLTRRRGAIKILHGEVALSRDAAARFILEARAANAIDHPGVVPALDSGETADGCPFLVMDLLEGETVEALRVRLGGRMSAAEVLSIADRALDVLAAAHDKKIVHRDVKPENLFVTSKGELKVLDFGIARCRELSVASHETTTGTLLGTLPFMAPEHAKGEWRDVDPRSDLWSVGATMFMLLAGQYVHDERMLARMLVAATTQPARAIGGVVPGLSGEVAAVVDRALAFAKDDRWPDARAMRAAVRQAAPANPLGATVPAR